MRCGARWFARSLVAVTAAGVFAVPRHASRSPEPPAEGILEEEHSPLGHIFQMSSFARPTVMSGSKEKTCDSPEIMSTLRCVCLSAKPGRIKAHLGHDRLLRLYDGSCGNLAHSLHCGMRTGGLCGLC